MNVLLRGIVGSVAYGLAGPGSDIDRLGVYAAPTEAFHGLRPPTGRAATVTSTKPDITHHEAGKYCALALNGNPTVMELLWLPDNLYEVRTELGRHLIDIRHAFLSRECVRGAYLGYAEQQFRRLERRGRFSSGAARRTSKHARHLARLCIQGLSLYRTGELRIRLDDPLYVKHFGEQVASGNVDAARQLLASHREAFDATSSPLPERPDEAAVESWLRRARRAHYQLADP